MHPVLRQLKPLPNSKPTSSATLSDNEVGECAIQENEGLARIDVEIPEQHPRVQIKKDSGEAYLSAVNTFRDRQGEEAAHIRHLKHKAGEYMQLDSRRILDDKSFEVDSQTGISPAKAHLAAADLRTAYQQTVKEEANFQKTFNNNVRTLINREEVVIGLMHLWDFAEAYVGNPSSKALMAQLCLISQHCRDDGILRESILNLAEPESRWLLDLLNILQTIIVQERKLSLTEKVAAINYSVITLSKYYARKIYKTLFVPIDKETKIATFYMRIVVQLLVLSDDLGMYRNARMERVVSESRRRELSDEELMWNLRRALRGEDSVSAPGCAAYDDDDYDDE